MIVGDLSLTCRPGLPRSKRPSRRTHARETLRVSARNILLFSKREAARAGIVLPRSDARAQHIQTQLNLQSGDVVKVGIVNGLKGTALVKAVEPATVTLAWNAWEDPSPPPPVTLLLAMPRPKALKRLWKQLAELGISRVVLTITETVPSGYATSASLRPHNTMLDILQGLEQAGDTLVPEIILEPSLSAALEVAVKPLGQQPTHEVTERPGVKKEWGRQKSILPAPPVASRPQPAPTPAASNGASAEACWDTLASAPVWPAVARGSAAGVPRVAAPAQPNMALPLVQRSDADEASDRMAFITQCLQVRRRQHDVRSRRTGARHDAAGSAERPWDPDFDPTAPLQVVCHPAARGLLSDAVVTYKQSMNAAGLCVWHSGELGGDSAPPTATAGAPSSTTAARAHTAVTTPPAAAGGSPRLRPVDESATGPSGTSGMTGTAGQMHEASADTASSAAGSTGGNAGEEGAEGSEGSGTGHGGREAGAGDYYYGSAGASRMVPASGAASSAEDSQEGGDSEGSGDEPGRLCAAAAEASADAAALEGFIGLCTEAFNVSDREGFSAAAAAQGVAGAQGTTAVDASRWGCGHVVLAVGPERGWTEAELLLLQRRGFAVVGMGPRALSSPTAVVAAVSIVQEALR
eukprot:jgi/Ulvmu1/11707/UM008_0118.1